ncbi:Battenin [Blattella germanica]|nr:Battenin [Blattella germanica]
MENEQLPLRPNPRRRNYANLAAYWILGLCNNFGYVVMLSAAHDILSTSFTHTDEVSVGYLLVAFSGVEWVAILGVAATSLGSGLGEVTLLSYSSKFDKNVISTWSSGTGAAGILGAGSYAGLTAVGLSPRNSLLVMLIVPSFMALTFWILLSHPGSEQSRLMKILRCGRSMEYQATMEPTPETTENSVTPAQPLSMKEKLRAFPPLLAFMVPLGLVYLFEYFINQGLFLNVIFFAFEAVYLYLPNIWIVFAAILWEGLLGGAAYVNTFYRISTEVPYERREFSMGITSLADAIGIGLAGAIALPVHDILCALPKP